MTRNEFCVVSPTDPDPQWPDGYVAVLREAGAQEKTIPYCIGWVRRFFARFPGRQRRDLGRTEIEAFLSETAAHPGVGNWQVQQARDALELYYAKFRGIPLEPREAVSARPHEPDPSVLLPTRSDIQNDVLRYTNQAVSVKRERTQVGEREGTPNAELPTPNVEVEKAAGGDARPAGTCDWKVLEDRMKDVLRTEHYAYATEQSYVAWVRRYVAFHGWRKPSTLEAEHLICHLLYGTGMRVSEGLRLRVQEIQFDQRRIVVRGAKNDKDRYVPLPRSDERPLREWLARRQALYEADKAKNMHEVEVPYALARKYPGAPFAWGWQYVFPADDYSTDPRSGHVRRHPLHEQTTMIYTHVLNKGPLGVVSPADTL